MVSVSFSDKMQIPFIGAKGHGCQSRTTLAKPSIGGWKRRRFVFNGLAHCKSAENDIMAEY